MKYAHWVFYAVLLAAVYGLARPASRAGRAVTAVTDALAGTLGSERGGGS